MNGDAEWNQWRGRTAALLESMNSELQDMNGRLQTIEKELYIMKGKTIAYGGSAAAVITIILQLAMHAIQ